MTAVWIGLVLLVVSLSAWWGMHLNHLAERRPTEYQMVGWSQVEQLTCPEAVRLHVPGTHSVVLIYSRRLRDLFHRREWFRCWHCQGAWPAPRWPKG